MIYFTGTADVHQELPETLLTVPEYPGTVIITAVLAGRIRTSPNTPKGLHSNHYRDKSNGYRALTSGGIKSPRGEAGHSSPSSA
jgi:hypothetical protein